MPPRFATLSLLPGLVALAMNAAAQNAPAAPKAVRRTPSAAAQPAPVGTANRVQADAPAKNRRGVPRVTASAPANQAAAPASQPSAQPVPVANRGKSPNTPLAQKASSQTQPSKPAVGHPARAAGSQPAKAAPAQPQGSAARHSQPGASASQPAALEQPSDKQQCEKQAGGARPTGQLDFISMLFVFMLATFIGLGVIMRVSRLLHTPLMSLTNAISAIAVVGSIVLAGSEHYPSNWYHFWGAVALFASMTNIVSGFLITDRMLKMFKTREGAK